jgi:hypothetical protein
VCFFSLLIALGASPSAFVGGLDTGMGLFASVVDGSAASVCTVNKESGKTANHGRLVNGGILMPITVCVKKLYKGPIFNEKPPASYRKNSRIYQSPSQ